MDKHQRASSVPFSSIVGCSVLLHDEEGRVVCQLGILGTGGTGEEFKANQEAFRDEVMKALNGQEAFKALHKIATEFCDKVDSEAEDIGGSRPMIDIVQDMGAAVDAAGPYVK